jgi:glycosyltransferase involved in cell wall biosynthesis
MRILVNTWSGLGPPAGIGHYAAQLVHALQQTAAEQDAVLSFPDGWLAQLHKHWQAPRKFLAPTGTLTTAVTSPWLPWYKLAKSCLTPWSEKAHALLRCTLGWFLERQFRTHRATLYHEPNFVPLTYDFPFVVTVHDLSPLVCPAWHPAYRVRWLERHLDASLRQAQHILTVSGFSRDELVRWCGVSADRIHVVYPGVRRHIHPQPMALVESRLRRVGLRRGYLLYVGTLEPRKNLERVLRVYLQLPRSLRWEVPFVLAGKYGWASQQLAELIAGSGPSEGVLALGYVPEQWLATLYCGARALIYPSLYEGFGLPPVEMLACGGQVVVSDIPVFCETLGPYAYRIPAEDSDGWYRMLRQLATGTVTDSFSPEAKSRWVARFDWLTCASQSWAIYKTPPLAIRLAA